MLFQTIAQSIKSETGDLLGNLGWTKGETKWMELTDMDDAAKSQRRFAKELHGVDGERAALVEITVRV